jgi:hypothetical protein
VADKGVVDNEAIQNELARYNRESQCAEKIFALLNADLCKGYKRMLHEKFTSIFKEMKTTGMTKSIFVIEQIFLF